MKKTFHHIEDFLADELFRSWVKEPTPESTEYWTNWVNSNEEYREVFMHAQSVVKGFKFQNPPVSEETEQRILNNILKQGSSSRSGAKNIWNYGRMYWRVAAMIFIALSFALYLYVSKDSAQSFFENPIITKSNGAGVKSKVRLPDGTIVSLNSESAIYYTKEFNDTIRSVKLEGEAYFEVSKNPHQPFIVKINELSVRALGTAFNIDAYHHDKVKVFLTEGKVKVTQVTETISNTVFLEPGQMSTSYADEGHLYKGTFQSADVIAWTRNELVFKEASFDEVIETLGRWYGVKFEVVNRDKIGVWSYSSRFKNPSLEQVLEVISATQSFNYSIDGKKVILTF